MASELEEITHMQVSAQEGKAKKLCNASPTKNRSAEEDLLGVQKLVMSDLDEEECTVDSATIEKAEENPHTAEEGTSIPDTEKENVAPSSPTSSEPGSASAAIGEQPIGPSRPAALPDPKSGEQVKSENFTNSKKRKKPTRLVDSDSGTDEDSNGVKEEEKMCADFEENADDVMKSPSVVSKYKKISALIDSESEAEMPTQKSPSVVSKYKKISALIDSESEAEMPTPKSPSVVSKYKKISALIDSESEAEMPTPKKSLSKPKKQSKRSDADGDVEKNAESKHKIRTKVASIVDSDTQSEQSDDNDGVNERHSPTHDKHSHDELPSDSDGRKNEGKSKPIRASAQKAMDDMLSIQSEQQRLHREAHISIPYHMPKRHSLQEFLKRHNACTLKAPSDGSRGSGTAVQSKHFKMSPDELAEYANLMEKRAKEATEFFKSESESEGEGNDQEVPQTNDTKSTLQGDDLEEGEREICSEAVALDASPATAVEVETSIQSVALEEEANIVNAVVTEVIELPRLDLSTVHITTSDEQPSTSSAAKLSRATLKELITAHSMEQSPTIKGDPNMLIDLDTGDLVAKQPSGPDKLLQRLLATNKLPKSKSSETLNILSAENGKVEMSKVNVHIAQDSKPQKEQKPGAAYLKLKENLKTIIAKKRLEELHKKQEELNEYNKCIFDDDKDDDDCEEYEPEDKPNKKIKQKQLDILIDDEENPIDIDDDLEDEEEAEAADSSGNGGIEDDAENVHRALETICNDDVITSGDSDLGTDDDSDLDERNDSENEENGQKPDEKRKHRIIQGFQDNSDDDDDMDFLKTPQLDTHSYSAALYEAESQLNFSDGEKELLGLCSGKFGSTQQSSAAPIISQIPLTQLDTVHDAATELEGLCSGTFDVGNNGATQPPTTGTQLHVTQLHCGKIISSDDERSSNAANTTEGGEMRRVKKLKKRVKRKAKLGFSDDEDESDSNGPPPLAIDDAEELQGDTKEEDEETEVEQPDTYVDYDSEENEIVIKMTKNDRMKQAQKFVENEAELSESDWGSADEDEKNMDTYDIELGDEDNFDREQLRTEVGQIHARKMLDQDLKEVRKLQEIFFEDEEQDGVGRQRQFKWKNAESGFSLDDVNNATSGDARNGESGDEENEHQWRKIRFEREQLLQQQQLKENSVETATPTILHVTTLSGSGTAALRKLNIITATKHSAEVRSSSPFLISKSAATLHKKTVRGSFLVRDREMLTKLVGNTRSGQDANGTAGTVSLKTIKPKNFVFATLTEEEHESLKRKSDDLMNSSNENSAETKKKPRHELRKDRCLIDQLL